MLPYAKLPTRSGEEPESLSVSCLRQALCATLGHRGELQAGKATPGDREFFRPKPLGVTAGFPRQDLCAEPDSYLRAPGPVAGGCALPASSARLSDQLRQCAVQDEEQPGQAFLGNFATGPLMAVIAAYGRCGSSCAPRTQVPERHEKSPSPRIPDAVSKNTVRLKLMTLPITRMSDLLSFVTNHLSLWNRPPAKIAWHQPPWPAWRRS